MDWNIAKTHEVTDMWGNVTEILTVTDPQGRVIFTAAHSTRANARAGMESTETVVRGVDVRERSGDAWMSNTLRYSSAPNSGTQTFYDEPGNVDAGLAHANELDDSDGYRFLRYADKGAKIPEGKSDAWYAGFDRAKKKLGRTVRKGVVMGDPRSW